MRYFDEMFRTVQLDRVAWVPLSPLKQRLYRLFPDIPDAVKDPPAFVTELLGITFYRHVDALLDEALGDEPEARQRIRDLLHEIMVDELAHIGQRRNFLGGSAPGWRAGSWPRCSGPFSGTSPRAGSSSTLTA